MYIFKHVNEHSICANSHRTSTYVYANLSLLSLSHFQFFFLPFSFFPVRRKHSCFDYIYIYICIYVWDVSTSSKWETKEKKKTRRREREKVDVFLLFAIIKDIQLPFSCSLSLSLSLIFFLFHCGMQSNPRLPLLISISSSFSSFF